MISITIFSIDYMEALKVLWSFQIHSSAFWKS